MTLIDMVKGKCSQRTQRYKYSANVYATKLAAQDSTLSDEALAHLKSYKYSSVDKSYISRYILKHYVLLPYTEHGSWQYTPPRSSRGGLIG